MTSFLLALIADVISGTTKQRLDAVEAFDTPPTSSTARRAARVTLGLFVVAAGFLFAAALLDVLAANRFASEVCGWMGIACLQLCVVSGLRYARLNRKADDHEG
ncbi:MAG: hypothetical protein AAF790_06430 [Planctomycetota bacterium]